MLEISGNYIRGGLTKSTKDETPAVFSLILSNESYNFIELYHIIKETCHDSTH